MNVQDRIDRTVAEWPPLTEAQKARVRAVLMSDVQAQVIRAAAADTEAEPSALDELLGEK